MDTKPSPPEPSVPINDVPQSGSAVIFKADKPAGSSMAMPKLNIKLALASLIMFFLVGGVGVGVYLVGQQQQIKSRASNEIPENLSAVVPKNIVNTSTPSTLVKPATTSAVSAKPNQSTASSSLANISIPEFDQSADLTSSESAELSDMYDFNGDQAANSVDLSIMYAGWGTPKNDAQKNADLNGDGIINGIDYSIFLPYFNKPL